MGREDLAGLEGDDGDLLLVDDGEHPGPGMGRADLEVVQAPGTPECHGALAVGGVVAEPEMAPGAGARRQRLRRRPARLARRPAADRPVWPLLVVRRAERVELGLQRAEVGRHRLPAQPALEGLVEALDPISFWQEATGPPNELAAGRRPRRDDAIHPRLAAGPEPVPGSDPDEAWVASLKAGTILVAAGRCPKVGELRRGAATPLPGALVAGDVDVALALVDERVARVVEADSPPGHKSLAAVSDWALTTASTAVKVRSVRAVRSACAMPTSAGSMAPCAIALRTFGP